jgi:hypothetical protein
MAKWFVLCRVSGGVTGTRESLLKTNGVVEEFATRVDAETVAKQCARLNHGRSRAAFEYRAIDAREAEWVRATKGD